MMKRAKIDKLIANISKVMLFCSGSYTAKAVKAIL